MQRKLVLALVDSLRTDMLLKTVASGKAPTFAALLERGDLIEDCVSSFPSVTPVCTSEIITGVRPDGHFIPGMNWYHRAERRYVEYGSSWEATRTFGLFSALYDTVYNLNMSHLSREVETLYEQFGDAGLRSACTPFLIYRGRRRHEFGLEGLLGRVATAAKFHHAVWGPEELFYGELYASQKVPCKPTLARPDARDDYSACVGVEMVERDLYDFMLFSLPDNDHYSHRHGPEASEASIAHADECFAAIVEAAGGIDAFLLDNAVILMADHAQTDVEQSLDLGKLLAEDWHVLQPNADDPGDAELAAGPSSRAAAVWVLRDGPRGRRLHEGVRATLGAHPGADLLAWLSDEDGRPVQRRGVGIPDADWAVVSRSGEQLRFAPGNAARDRRGRGWRWQGDLGVLELELSGGIIDSATYPDAFSRLWAALRSPFGGDVLLSAAPGYELVDWGGATHIPGGSHGSLLAGDSLAPLLTVGLQGDRPSRDQWAISDVADLALAHFGLGSARSGRTPGAPV
ncbi:MAG: alkaline phosphatase family protein [Solirubrobacterales bacterium]